VRADGERVLYRILYANEGSKNRILLALEGFKKKTRKTPPAEIRLAKRRLSIWRHEGEARKNAARRAARKKRS
jgi:phage-related protein